MSTLPPSDRTDADLPDMSAGEYALGLLDGDERAVATRRVLADPAFARAVETWRTHFAPLFAQWPEIASPDLPDLFLRIERSLHGAPVASVTALKDRRPGNRSASKVWPGIAAVASVAAAALLLVVVTRPVPVPLPPPAATSATASATAPATAPAPAPSAPTADLGPTLVASITPTAKGTPVTVVYDATANSLRLTEAKLADASRAAELWVIPAGGTPHSLGILASRGGTALTPSAANRARIAAGATLAVSLEPIGGSRTGLPTGPVVATGALTRV